MKNAMTIKAPKYFKSRKEWEVFLWSKVIEYLSQASKDKNFGRTLEKLFSDYERDLAMRRLTALFLLNDGKSYREIGEMLWISPATISNVRKVFSGKISAGYSGRRRAVKNRMMKPEDFLIKDGEEINDGFLMQLLGILVYMQESYRNPKKRWEFLGKH